MSVSVMSSPEPMSPGSPQNIHNTSMSSCPAYLPGYLLGDQTPVSGMSSPNLWSQATSPPKNKSNLSKLNSMLEQPQRRVTFSPLPPSSMRIISERSNSDKHGGPPTQGLFDETCNPVLPNNSTSKQLSESLGSRSFNATNNSFLNSSLGLDGRSYETEDILRTDSYVSHAEDRGSWITIYGFPLAAASFTLQQFSQYGSILKHKMADKGNWMHVCYQSKLQAKRALSKNGKIVGGTIMVGVKLCDDKIIIEDTENENSLNISNVSVLKDSGMDQTHANSFNKSANMRSLTQAYKVSANDREVSSPGMVPRKNNSVISKAMDYVFGW